MQRLKIDALKVRVTTQVGSFGTELFFNTGLNIIRANNTSGKSTCINSIIYALGLEIILGKKGRQSQKPVLKDELEFNELKYPVTESFVELQITNENSKSITLKRFIKSEYDDRLIILVNGKKLTNSEQVGPEEHYYVHDKGAATQAKGFHAYLKDFLGWELPSVKTYDDTETMLYVECIMPLMFIEQFRGWSGIQSTTPTFFGIKNVKKMALEFLLNLDVSIIDKQKLEILNRKENIKRKWSELENQLGTIASRVNGIVKDYPLHPVTQLGPEELPQIYVNEKEKWLLINERGRKIIDDILKIDAELQPTVPDNNKLKDELDGAQSKLFYLESNLTSIKQENLQVENDREQLLSRMDLINVDIKKNQDVLKIQNFGVKQKSLVAESLCPTCHQEINKVLLPPSYHEPTMSIEENIEFLRQQKDAANIVAKNLGNRSELKRKEVLGIEEDTSNIRQKIKDLKNDLLSSQDSPHVSKIREKIVLEEMLKNYNLTKDTFEDEREKLFSYIIEWTNVLELESTLPRDSFSISDNQKLIYLGDVLAETINFFDYKSTFIEDIHISRDTYKPVIEGFEMISDASASDNIRLIWAYTISLQSLNSKFATNHLGISIFDEPGQQEVENKSIRHFYQKLDSFDKSDNQFIIATSVKKDVLNDLVKDLSPNLINFDDDEKIIQKIN